MDITLVAQDRIDAVWPSLKEYAVQAAEYTYGRFTANDIRTGLKTKNQQLWVAHEGDTPYGFVVTQCADYPQLRGLVMHFTAGKDIEKWKEPMLKWIRKYAKSEGCDIIESYGRGGWERIFKSDGFKKRFMFYELPVEAV